MTPTGKPSTPRASWLSAMRELPVPLMDDGPPVEFDAADAAAIIGEHSGARCIDLSIVQPPTRTEYPRLLPHRAGAKGPKVLKLSASRRTHVLAGPSPELLNRRLYPEP